MRLNRLRLFPEPVDVTGCSVLCLELELDYVSRHALLTAAHWIPGILGFVVLEVLGAGAGAGAQAGAGAEFLCSGGSPLTAS